MVFQMFYRRKSRFNGKPITDTCLMLLLALVLFLFNPAAAWAQSSIIMSPRISATGNSVFNNEIPSSISSAQGSTEAMLSRSVSTIGIGYDQKIVASYVFKSLGVTVFVDQNLEGVFDTQADLEMKAGVSGYRSLQHALIKCDSSLIVESDGSILIISIDDEWEPSYLRPVTYDVTGITGSLDQAQRLAGVLQNTISSDSWEQNGGGNGTLSIYAHNGRILMIINQSYKIHFAIRSHFQSVARLSAGGVVTVTPSIGRGEYTPSPSSPSSIVTVPVKQIRSSLRSRR